MSSRRKWFQEAAEPDPIDQTGPATQYAGQAGYGGDHADQPAAEPQGDDATQARLNGSRGNRWRQR
jgi:hypothetical protein